MHKGRWDPDIQNQHGKLHIVMHVSTEKRFNAWGDFPRELTLASPLIMGC
jgi:hypothetical protein